MLHRRCNSEGIMCVKGYDRARYPGLVVRRDREFQEGFLSCMLSLAGILDASIPIMARSDGERLKREPVNRRYCRRIYEGCLSAKRWSSVRRAHWREAVFVLPEICIQSHVPEQHCNYSVEAGKVRKDKAHPRRGSTRPRRGFCDSALGEYRPELLEQSISQTGFAAL